MIAFNTVTSLQHVFFCEDNVDKICVVSSLLMSGWSGPLSLRYCANVPSDIGKMLKHCIYIFIIRLSEYFHDHITTDLIT